MKAIKIFFLTGFVRTMLLLLPFKMVLFFIKLYIVKKSVFTIENSLDNEKIVNDIGPLIRKVSRITPWKSACLVQAIVARIMLRKLSINQELYLGVRKNAANKLNAHAWFKCGKVIVVGGEVAEEFQIISVFVNKL